MSGEGRNTNNRDKFRRAIAKDKPPCYRCGNPIDYTLPHDDPWSFQIDHVMPLARGGTDTLDNCAAAHRKCNRDKSDDLPMPIGVTFITERTW